MTLEHPVADETARLHVRFRAHWVNAWFVHLLAHPVTRVGGDQHLVSWTGDTVIGLPAGEHLVETSIRYRGTPWDLGTGRLRLHLQPGEDVEVVARNGWLNQTPFVPHRVLAPR